MSLMDIHLRKLKREDYNSVGNFIANLNGQDFDNICDLGTSAAEIENFIHHDLLDMKAEEGFILAHDSDKLIGVFGLDIDLEKSTAYLLGPYIRHKNWREIADTLWSTILSIMPESIARFKLSPNSKNKNCIEFAESNGFYRHTEGLVLKLERKGFHFIETDDIIELSDNRRADFAVLHDQLFPNTYYTGQDILGRCNDHRKVFINGDMTGYIYVEAQPEYGESNIEFIGVHQSQRGRGLGARLLNRAIQWIFSHESINSINLNVSADNPARRLYEKAGFKVSSKVYGYAKDI
jgi:ribosomal protein S18 acetylase RimI-like enzyme